MPAGGTAGRQAGRWEFAAHASSATVQAALASGEAIQGTIRMSAHGPHAAVVQVGTALAAVRGERVCACLQNISRERSVRRKRICESYRPWYCWPVILSMPCCCVSVSPLMPPNICCDVHAAAATRGHICLHCSVFLVDWHDHPMPASLGADQTHPHLCNNGLLMRCLQAGQMSLSRSQQVATRSVGRAGGGRRGGRDAAGRGGGQATHQPCPARRQRGRATAAQVNASASHAAVENRDNPPHMTGSS